jgi:hypothetical protein
MSKKTTTQNELMLSMQRELDGLSEASVGEIVESSKQAIRVGRAFHSQRMSTAGVVGYWSVMDDIEKDIANFRGDIKKTRAELKDMEEGGWDEVGKGSLDDPETLDGLDGLDALSDPEGKSKYERYQEKKAELQSLIRQKNSLQSKYVDLLGKGSFKELNGPSTKNNISIYLNDENDEGGNDADPSSMPMFGSPNKKKKVKKQSDKNVIDILNK